MAPKTRKPVAKRSKPAVKKRRSNLVSRDGGGTEEHEHQQNEQEPDLEVNQQPIQKQVTARSTRSATASRTARSGILDRLQMMDNQQQLQPQAAIGKVAVHTTRGTTRNQSGYRGLEETNLNEEHEIQNDEEHRNQETAPRSQRSTVNRSLNHGYLEEGEMEEHTWQENEQFTNLEVTDALKNALQILTASGSRRTTTNRNSHSAFQDNHQRQENGQWRNRGQIRPPISEQASCLVWSFKVITPTTRKATGSHAVRHRLQDEIQMEVDRLHQNEEQPDLQRTQRVMASSTRRSNAKRKFNQGFSDRDEIEEHGQQGNEQPNLEFTQEVENALKFLMAPSTLRAITDLNSRSGYQDKNQMKENGQPQNSKQLQPQVSHQASVMASRTWRATTNQSGHNILRDKDQSERDRQHQNEEQPEFLTTQQTKDQQDMDHCVHRAISIGSGQNTNSFRTGSLQTQTSDGTSSVDRGEDVDRGENVDREEGVDRGENVDREEGVEEGPLAIFDGRTPLQMNPDTGKIFAHHRISREITSSFQRLPSVTGFTWKLISQKQKDEYYKEFRNAFSWPSDWEHEVKKMWDDKAAKRYSGFISSLKKIYTDGKSRPTYVPPEMWSGLIDHWKDPKVIEKSEAAKKARMSEPDGPGTGIRRQRGGSLSIEERAMRKAAERGVSVMDCVYEAFHDTHMFKDGSYTSKRAADIDARVREIAATRGDKANLSQIFINDIFGGKLDKKKRMFGTGNLAESLVSERATGMNAHASAGLDPSVRAEIREELRQELREELREEIHQELNVDREKRTKIENDVAVMQKMVKQLMKSHKSSHSSSRM